MFPLLLDGDTLCDVIKKLCLFLIWFIILTATKFIFGFDNFNLLSLQFSKEDKLYIEITSILFYRYSKYQTQIWLLTIVTTFRISKHFLSLRFRHYYKLNFALCLLPANYSGDAGMTFSSSYIWFCHVLWTSHFLNCVFVHTFFNGIQVK